jgi:RNA polymerase sigma-32 factor
MKKKTSSKPAKAKPTKAAGSASTSTAQKAAKSSSKPAQTSATKPVQILAAKPSTKPSTKSMRARAPKSSKVAATAPAKPTVAKPVMAEVVYENAGPTPINESQLEPNKAYSVPAEEAADDSFDLETDVASSTSLVPAETRGGLGGTSDPLALYLSDIRKYPVLSKEKELEIAKRYYETKDPEAAQILIKSNLRFVVKVAADYSRFGAKMIDLIQEGNVGLMHAVREYNPYKGARLITYAVWWIRGYIQEYLMRQYSMVRIGTTQNQRRLFYQLQKEKEALDSMGQTPNLALLSSRLGIPEDEIEQMSQRMSGRDVSLDRPLDDESGSSLMDLQRSASDMSLDERIAHEEQLEILKKKIESLRPELSDREKIILDERILNDEPLTLQEIGEKHGITREAVRQMEVRVLKKIKSKMEFDS